MLPIAKIRKFEVWSIVADTASLVNRADAHDGVLYSRLTQQAVLGVHFGPCLSIQKMRNDDREAGS